VWLWLSTSGLVCWWRRVIGDNPTASPTAGQLLVMGRTSPSGHAMGAPPGADSLCWAQCSAVLVDAGQLKICAAGSERVGPRLLEKNRMTAIRPKV